jgi:L-glutamine-phosphate cytidylyltransferase
MKAIILAAGQGTRLRPLTDHRPKCMVEYEGKPIIGHIFNALDKAGLKEYVVVAGYQADVLADYAKPFGAKIVVNHDYECTNMVHSLFCAEEELHDDVLITYSDIVYSSAIAESMIRSTADLAIAIDTNWRWLWEQRMPDPLSDAETMQLDSDGNVTDLGRKPLSYDEIQGQYMGIIRMSSGTLSKAKEMYHGFDPAQRFDGKSVRQMYMTSFLRELIRAGHTCKSIPTHGGWLEIDAPSDLSISIKVTGA